jgi:hypothetical protein
MSILDDLATLPVNAEFDVPVNDDSYADPTPPAPLKEGNYRLRVVKFSLDKKKDGTPNLTDGLWPVINLERVEVVEPAEFAGRVAVSFERVYSKPFNRGGGMANGLADLTRSMDQTRSYNNPRDGIAILDELVQSGTTFRARIGWEGYDKDFYDQQVSNLGGESMIDNAKRKELRKAATIKGMKSFPQHADGSHASVVTGKSGSTVTARARIASVYPSGQDVKI